MIVKRGRGDLNKVYRPCKISEVVGHDTQKKTIGNALEQGTLPHSVMFVGPSGCGKTTFARQIGTYPLIIGIKKRIPLKQFVDVKITGE